MKYFDIHAHVFPGKVAGRVIDALQGYYHACWSGTGEADDLRHSMEINGIDRAVIFSSATRADQVQAVNDYLCEVQQSDPEHFFAMGTIHPDFPDPAREIERIRQLGLHGLKLHPDFQKIYIDEPRMMRIYGNIGNDLPLIFHIGDRRTDFSSPWRLARLLDEFPELKIVAAHFGGYSEWDEAWKHLVGRDLWFDTSSTLRTLSLPEARKIAHAHGAEKLLFGSDYPAVHHDTAISDVLALDFSPEDNEKIFHLNAEKLFGSENE